MKNFKLSQAVFEVSQGSKEVKYKLVKTAISSVLVFGSIFGLTGCSGNNDKPEEIQTPTEDVLEPVAPEKTPEELEVEALLKTFEGGDPSEFPVVDRDYDNAILERYNKTMGYLYNVTFGNDQHEELHYIPPTEEGLAELQQHNHKYTLIARVIIPCYFKYSSSKNKWRKVCPQTMKEIDPTLFKAVDDKYRATSDDVLNEVFGTETVDEYQSFDLEKNKDKVKTR